MQKLMAKGYNNNVFTPTFKRALTKLETWANTTKKI